MFRRFALSLAVMSALVLGAAQPCLGQTATEQDIFAPVTDPSAGVAQKPVKPLPQKVKTAAAAKAPKADVAAPSATSEADQRISHLEEQIADIHVVVGTLESMSKTRAGGAVPSINAAGEPASTGGGDLDVRVGRLETQLQVMSGQLTDLANQMRAQSAGRQQPAALLAPKAPALQPVVPGKQSALTAALSEQPANADTGFGQTTVVQQSNVDPAAQGQADTFDTATQMDNTGASQGVTTDSNQVAALAPEAPSADPQIAYDQAYSHILQQDYAGAEGAFRDYIARFPQAPLASNAHYWLGQSFYARGQYKLAADAFLKGYKSYRTGQKAPDSLLKVAMSLSRLGQKDMSCSAFTALDTEFPNSSVQVKHLAQTERERTGC